MEAITLQRNTLTEDLTLDDCWDIDPSFDLDVAILSEDVTAFYARQEAEDNNEH